LLLGEARVAASSGRGTISSFVVYHQAFFAYFKDRLPYAVAQVSCGRPAHERQRAGIPSASSTACPWK
jgi:uncharacterized OB-fold protein